MIPDGLGCKENAIGKKGRERKRKKRKEGKKKVKGGRNVLEFIVLRLPFLSESEFTTQRANEIIWQK